MMVGYLMRLFNKLPWRRWKTDAVASTTEIVHIWSKCTHESVLFGSPHMLLESGPWWKYDNERFFDWPVVGDEYVLTMTISRVPEHEREVPRDHVLAHIAQWVEDGHEGQGYE